uniref:Uncharacterized protein n=1 Tax=Rhizophora mucronata TaxID=61149 RepID=A0A2P2Q404_RHIMU
MLASLLLGPLTRFHNPQQSCIFRTPAILSCIIGRVLFCGKALIFLRIHFFLCSHSLKTRNLSPQEAKQTVLLVSTNWFLTTTMFLLFSMMVPRLPVSTGHPRGLIPGKLGGSRTTALDLLGLIHWENLLHQILSLSNRQIME